MKQITIFTLLIIIFLSPFYSQESAEYNSDLNFAQVKYVKALKQAKELWTFYVTVRHKDEGWSHYADLWIVVDAETDEILGERVLAHPHEKEQPFVRSLSSVKIPEGITLIEIKAKCNLHGYEGKRVIIDLNLSKSEDYEIIY